MINKWLDLIYKVAVGPSLANTGVRKIAADISWEISGDDLEHELTYSDLNYKQSKHKQLVRTYWNQDGVDAAIAKMKSREGAFHTSVAIPLVNAEKKRTSQGHCMQTLVVTHLGDGYTSIDIYYRSTELIQKFLADMVFFSIMLPPVFKKMGVKPEVIRFKFANVYLSAVFAPIWIRYANDLQTFFSDLEDQDPRFHRRFGLATRRLLRENHNYGYRTQAAMFEYYKRHEDAKKTKLLREILGKIEGGKPMEE